MGVHNDFQPGRYDLAVVACILVAACEALYLISLPKR